MRLTTQVSIFSLLLLAACGSKNERPDAKASWINKPGLKLVTYNMKTDYDEYGNRLPEAKPVVTQFATCEAMLTALNVSVCFDPLSQRELKRSLDQTQKYVETLKDRCGSKCWGL